MAASWELLKKLARRRTGEQVFEKSAAASQADVVSRHRSGVRIEGGREAVFEKSAAASQADVVSRYRSGVRMEGGHEAVFEKSAAASQADVVSRHCSGVRMEGGHEAVFESTASASSADAKHSSSSSKEVVVSSGSAAAFAQALARIQAFERGEKITWTPEEDKKEEMEYEFVEVERSSGVKAEAEAATNSKQTSVEQPPSTEERQQDFKSAVRERFNALLSEGMSPNEAAAQAIREATLAATAGPSGGAAPGACGNSAAPAAEVIAPQQQQQQQQQTCASSAKDVEARRQQAQQQKRTIAVRAA